MRISDNSRMQLSSQDTKRAICGAGLKMKRMGRDRVKNRAAALTTG